MRTTRDMVEHAVSHQPDGSLLVHAWDSRDVIEGAIDGRGPIKRSFATELDVEVWLREGAADAIHAWRTLPYDRLLADEVLACMPTPEGARARDRMLGRTK